MRPVNASPVRSGRRLSTLALLGTATALVVASCSSTSKTTSTSASTSLAAPTSIVVQAGANDQPGTSVAVLQFMPATVNVVVGTPVNWSWAGDIEPHSVTFTRPGQQLPPPGDPSVFGPTPATGPYDGTTFVNSGLQPLGPAGAKPFSLTFAKAGTYTYHCVIHPNMVGHVVVAPAGGSADTAASVAARMASEKATWVAEGRAAAHALAATSPAGTKNPDGTTTWRVKMGASTPHTDILAFAPVPVAVKAGDKVQFVNDSGAPHTASFFGTTPPILNPTDPRTDKPAPGPSPQKLSLTGFFNTGLLPPNAPPGTGPPLAARSFTFIVPAAGTYTYQCILHASSGMAGQIAAT
jgi:plastocyanin